MKKLQVDYDAIVMEKYDSISTYHEIREQLDRLSNEFRTFLTNPTYLLPFLQPGRMVKVSLKNIFLFVKKKVMKIINF